MKCSKLILGLAVATAIVGTATPAYAYTDNFPHVGVTLHLVNKLTGEKIAEDVHLEDVKSSPNDSGGFSCTGKTPYVDGYNVLVEHKDYSGNPFWMAEVPYVLVDDIKKSYEPVKEISTTIYYEKAVGGSTQNSTRGWYQSNGSWYYNNSNGQMKKGWLYDNGNWYYLDISGRMQTGWIDDGRAKYYLYSTGEMATGFINLGDDAVYYLDPSQGNLVTGWRLIDGHWYYFNKEAKDTREKGFMQTGWLYDNGSWYYFYGNGQMATGFINLGGDAYYYLDESNTSNIGIMKTGWQKINGYWYYFNTSNDSGITGMMKKGWQKIGGVWYYFYYGDGKMAYNTTIDGYYVNSSGEWSQTSSRNTNNVSTAVSDSGNSSSNEQIVTFADKKLEQVVRNTINKPTGTLYKGDVENITELSAFNNDISNLSGIENLVNLQNLKLDCNLGNSVNSKISDISPLKGLTNLQSIYLNDAQISDISALRGLTNLQKLNLGHNKIKDISALKGLTNLQTLELYNNQINDISALKELTNLQTLNLISDPIGDISTLKGLTNLQTLYLNDTSISDADKQSLKDALPKCDIYY